MNKDQALNILAELAFKADLPKGLTGNDAKIYIEQITTAINILKAIIKDEQLLVMKFLTVEFLLQFIALFIGILSAFIRFNNKTEKNTLLIVQLEKDIQNIKAEEKENYTKLENKISRVENDIRCIAADIGEIKGILSKINDNK